MKKLPWTLVSVVIRCFVVICANISDDKDSAAGDRKNLFLWARRRINLILLVTPPLDHTPAANDILAKSFP